MKRKLVVFTSMILVLSMLSGCLVSNNKRRRSSDDDDDDDDYTRATTEATSETDDTWSTDDTSATDNGKTKYLDTGWSKLEITEDDMGKLYTKIIYTEGVPDDFVLYGTTTFGDVSKAIRDNNEIRDSISQTVKPFDIELFRKVCTIFWFGADEYSRMNSKQSRQSILTQLAYLATLSFEFACDNFDPEYAMYDDSMESYPANGFVKTANYFGSLIDAALDK